MRQRCQNPKNYDFHKYGAKGITVTSEWNDFLTFYAWAMENGYSDNLTIDRIDANGNYEPSNCRWVSYKIQANNRSNNRQIEYKGETHTLAEWSDITGLKASTIWARLKSGWTVEKALESKVKI